MIVNAKGLAAPELLKFNKFEVKLRYCDSATMSEVADDRISDIETMLDTQFKRVNYAIIVTQLSRRVNKLPNHENQQKYLVVCCGSS